MIYLTYNIKTMSDGMCAQYQRIIGIICIALHYKLIYVHTKIENMDRVKNIKYLNFIEDYFQFYRYFENVDLIEYDEIYEISNPSIEEIMSKNIENKNILIKMSFPYNMCDKNTLIYSKNINFLQKILFNNKNKNNKLKKIAIHVRRGDVSINQNSERYITIETIVNIVKSLKNKYKNTNIYIYTQIDNKNKNEFDIFKNDKSVIIVADLDPIYTLNNLILADVLVISKSSFSYVAGLYNKNTVYYFDFWHSPLNNWININKLLKEQNELELYNYYYNKIFDSSVIIYFIGGIIFYLITFLY